MSFLKKALAGLATATLAFAPISASAAPARVDAPMSESSDLRGGGAGGTVMLALVAAGFVYVIYELISGDDHDRPVSP